MLTLRSAPPSPFGRKVKIAAAILGLADRIEIVDADTNDPDEALRRQNPLGKIPTLVLENGATLYDSRVILDYLNSLARDGERRIVPKGKARFDALTRQALADGLMDAALLQVYEGRWRAEDRRDQKWLDHQAGKVERALAIFEANPPKIDGTVDIGHIALACALGYLDLRFGGRWRADHPKLVAWLEAFAAQVPAFEATKATA